MGIFVVLSSLNRDGVDVMENKNNMKIQVRATGYYSGIFNKVHLLKEGQMVELIGTGTEFEDPKDAWKCRMSDGRPVFVEFENGKEVELSN